MVRMWIIWMNWQKNVSAFWIQRRQKSWMNCIVWVEPVAEPDLKLWWKWMGSHGLLNFRRMWTVRILEKWNTIIICVPSSVELRWVNVICFRQINAAAILVRNALTGKISMEKWKECICWQWRHFWSWILSSLFLIIRIWWNLRK